MDETPTKDLGRDLIAPYLKPLSPIGTGLLCKGELEPPIRCLLCDIYGTLLISASGDINRETHRSSGFEALPPLLERHGITRSADEIVTALHAAIKHEHARAKMGGVAYPEVQIDKIWAQLLPDKTPSQILAFAMAFEMVLNPVWPMPCLPEMLSACRKGDIVLGIISNAQFFTPLLIEWLAEAPLEELGFHPDLIFFSYRHGIAKPSDKLFQKAGGQLKKMGITPHQTAYIGNDMRKDILPARRQGFQTILFAGDARSLRLEGETNEKHETLPDLVVTGLNQVISSLQPSEQIRAEKERKPGNDQQ